LGGVVGGRMRRGGEESAEGGGERNWGGKGGKVGGEGRV